MVAAGLLLQGRWHIYRNLGHCISWPTINSCHWSLLPNTIHH